MTAPAGQSREGSKRPGFLRSAVESLSTLKFKATALVVILTMSVTVAVAAYLLQSSGQVARAQHEAQLLNAAALLSDAAAALIASGEEDQLQALASERANGQPLLYVIVSDKEGRQLAVSEHKKATLLVRLENEASQAQVPGVPMLVPPAEGAPLFLDVTYPITLRQASASVPRTRPTELLGYVRTGIQGNAWQQNMASTLDLVIGVGVLSLLAAVPLGFLLVRRIVSPLEGLAETMLQFSQGRLDVRSKVARQDEIGRLARAFNQMADQHQQTNQRMRRLNAELEERVAHRTQQLRELASREPLTGLYNRRFFNDTMERRFAEAMRYGDDLACVMIDLDDFKHANDTFGHQVGDELLILTARTLLGQLRAADVAARFGGDEFVLLLPQTDCDQARSLAERIIERFAGELRERFPEVRVSMSIGISSMHHSHAPDAETLVRAADHALYDAKSMGKNKVWVDGQAATAAAAG